MVTNLAEYLPEMLSIKGRPMTLDNHFAFVPMFETNRAPLTVLVAGRQLGKSRSCAADLILRAAIQSGHETLVVLPLQDQSDRLSNLIFKPMIIESPIAAILAPDGEVGNVRTHMYSNGSVAHFSYASDNAERMRGITAKVLYVDEAQDMESSFVPLMYSCVDGQEDSGMLVSGSSKTKDTFLYEVYQDSSQGVWHIKCSACGFDNKCCLEPDGHILAMIDTKPRNDISEKRPGTLCKQCRNPVNPRNGRWVHRYPENVRGIAGYHIPQILMPGHYASQKKWNILVSKMSGGLGFTTGRFYNEVLGEPYDMAYKMITVDDIRAAAKGLGPNSEANAVRLCGRYSAVILGVDWGGGGEDGVSRTKVAAAGMRGDGHIEVFYGMQFPPGSDPVAEATEVVRIANLIRATGVAHDFNGAGTVSESVMTHLGLAINRIIPIKYNSYPGMAMFSFQPATGARVRRYYQMDKGRSLQFICSAIKAKAVSFFDYDHVDVHRPGLLHDFMALVSHNVDTPNGSVFRVRKQSKSMTDDFAHAVNFACAALWESFHCWPNVGVIGAIGGAGI